MNDIEVTLCDADVLIIVPPFGALECPSLAAHLLQACGRETSISVRVLYANMLFASAISESEYQKICSVLFGPFCGERLFARCAFGLPPLGHNSDGMFTTVEIFGSAKAAQLTMDPIGSEEEINFPDLRHLEPQAIIWADQVAAAVSARNYKIVGCTTTFEQTVASVALLNRIKRLRPDIITILGGANCEGEMAQGMASLGTSIDYIFSGESEKTFPRFVQSILAGSRPKDRLIYGEPCRNMDMLPTPICSEFYEQRARYLSHSNIAVEETWISYETSRGCWWGQKQHCLFCGLNGEGMAFRQKSADRVIEELRLLLEIHPSCNIHMTDNIMPHGYFKTLVPRLDGEVPGVHIFYEQKANLSLQNVFALKMAGVIAIQAGIEALSSRLLRQMKKGVLARQNLMLLRYARAADLDISWNLLWGLPGDEVAAYEETLALIPLLHHLQPPTGVWHVSIDRFSPYFSRPAEFGVRNVRPLKGYYDFLPQTADVRRVAYHFTGNYQCGAYDRIDVVRQVRCEVGKWRSEWERNGQKQTPPDLRICPYQGWYVLADTRGLPSTEEAHVLDREEAALLLTARPYTETEWEVWALENKVAVIVDDWFIPLAIADPELLLEFEAEQKGQQTLRTSSFQDSVEALMFV